jgi:hypothetical protein
MLKDQNSTNQLASPLWLIAMPFVLGLLIRFVGLGQPFLDNVEANLAIGIHDMVMGQGGIVTQPLYSQITGVLFWLFEDTNFVARFLPAFVGGLLVLFPWFLGDNVTNRQKLILSFGVALDPALIAASKTGSSLILAVLAMAAIWVAFSKRRPVLLGVSFAALLLTGSYFLTGLIIFAITLLWMLKKSEKSEAIKQEVKQFGWKEALISFAISYVLLASFAFLQTSGIGAGFQDIAGLLGKPDPYKVPIGIGALFFGVVIYELFPLVVSIFSVTAYRREMTVENGISLRWIVVGLLVILLNGNRTALDLVWISVPLWIVASFGIEKIISGVGKIQPLAVAAAAFYLLLLGFVLFTWVGAVNIEFDQQRLLIRVVLIAGGLLLLVISYWLSRYSWDIVTANQGLLIGVGSVLLLFGLLTQSWHSANWGNQPENELWRAGSYPVDADRLLVSVEDISEMHRGRRQGQEILVYALDLPSIEWHLREQAVRKVVNISGAETPEMLLSDLVEPEFWSAEYTGQDFLFGATPDWSLLTWREWQKWIIFRDLPLYLQEWGILWVRTDLFPGIGINQ